VLDGGEYLDKDWRGWRVIGKEKEYAVIFKRKIEMALKELDHEIAPHDALLIGIGPTLTEVLTLLGMMPFLESVTIVDSSAEISINSRRTLHY